MSDIQEVIYTRNQDFVGGIIAINDDNAIINMMSPLSGDTIAINEQFETNKVEYTRVE